jgi:hypothetical protein
VHLLSFWTSEGRDREQVVTGRTGLCDGLVLTIV